MKSNRSGIVIAVILLVLIAAGLYYFTRDHDGGTGETAQPAPQSEQSEPAESSGTSAETNSADDDTGADQQQAGLRVPTFDVLRVEPDGTAVIAGAAEPLGRLDVKEGDAVITSSEVDGSGNFVAIIDMPPLPPGDHQIYLDVTMPDGRTARSQQTATISIPETPDGELLALISEPGKASELIAVPDEDKNAPRGAVIADNRTAAGQSGSNEDGETAQGSDTQDNTQLQSVTVETDAEKTAQAGNDQGADDRSGQDVNALVSIKAVEIEGRHLFVAGQGAPGATIRGYIDDALIGDAEVNVEGNYVLDAEIDVAVGLHTIRVDMLDENGDVIARAVVPFDRPPGDQVAAVSSAPAMVGEAQADGTQTFTQPKLEGSDNAVIIRRGDNLWRISRRMYGRGVRYTTIYLANETQIADPNLILPGQVFSVPKEPLPIGEAETIHRRLLDGMPLGPEYHLPPGDR